MTVVSMVYMVTVAGLDPLQMVLVGTVLELSAFLFEIPTRVIADTVSRKLSIVIGYIMMGLGYMLLGFFPSFEMILLSNFIWGVGSTFLSGAVQAWISDEIGESKANSSFILASQFGKVGGLLGIPVCIGLALIDLSYPIILGSLGLVLLGLFNWMVMQETSFSPLADEERSTWKQMGATFQKGITFVKGSTILKLIIVIAVFEGVFSEGFDRLYTPHLIERFEFPAMGGMDTIIWWGVLAAGSMLLALGALEIIKRRVNMNHYRSLIVTLSVASTLLVFAVAGFALTGNFYIAVITYFAVAVLRSIKAPLTAAWLNQNLASETRATIFSMQQQADGFGQMGGGPLIGLIGKYVSLSSALVVSALALVPALLLYFGSFKEEKAKE